MVGNKKESVNMEGKPSSSFHSNKSKANGMNLVMTGNQIIESNKRTPGSAGEPLTET